MFIAYIDIYAFCTCYSHPDALRGKEATGHYLCVNCDYVALATKCMPWWSYRWLAVWL